MATPICSNIVLNRLISVGTGASKPKGTPPTAPPGRGGQPRRRWRPGPQLAGTSQPVSPQGRLTGLGGEDLPTIVIVAHYDAFGVAPVRVRSSGRGGGRPSPHALWPGSAAAASAGQWPRSAAPPAPKALRALSQVPTRTLQGGWHHGAETGSAGVGLVPRVPRQIGGPHGRGWCGVRTERGVRRDRPGGGPGAQAQLPESSPVGSPGCASFPSEET